MTLVTTNNCLLSYAEIVHDYFLIVMETNPNVHILILVQNTDMGTVPHCLYLQTVKHSYFTLHYTHNWISLKSCGL